MSGNVHKSDFTRQRLFGRRKGRRLSPYRQNLYDNLLPEIACAKDTPLPPFGDYESYVLEIGFGGGEHLAELAARNPHTGFVGCEVFINGIASLLSQCDKRGLQNIRIFSDDARYLLPLIADGFFSHIYLLFPDPWHKSRHAKRRLLQKSTVPEFARILKDGGGLHIASDNPLYIRHALTCLQGSVFRWLAEQPGDFLTPPTDHIQTRYEAKALSQTRTPTYLNYRKLP